MFLLMLWVLTRVWMDLSVFMEVPRFGKSRPPSQQYNQTSPTVLHSLPRVLLVVPDGAPSLLTNLIPPLTTKRDKMYHSYVPYPNYFFN